MVNSLYYLLHYFSFQFVTKYIGTPVSPTLGLTNPAIYAR